MNHKSGSQNKYERSFRMIIKIFKSSLQQWKPAMICNACVESSVFVRREIYSTLTPNANTKHQPSSQPAPFSQWAKPKPKRFEIQLRTVQMTVWKSRYRAIDIFLWWYIWCLCFVHVSYSRSLSLTHSSSPVRFGFACVHRWNCILLYMARFGFLAAL